MNQKSETGLKNSKNPKIGFFVRVDADAEEICGLSLSVAEQIVFECLNRSGITIPEKEAIVSVSCVSSEEMRLLNKQHRGKDAPTDVLSFSQYEDRSAIEREKRKEILLGDVILSKEVVQCQAEEDGVSVEHECAYLLAHGVLHLLGYDHEAEQFSIQDEICDILISRKKDENG